MDFPTFYQPKSSEERIGTPQTLVESDAFVAILPISLYYVNRICPTEPIPLSPSESEWSAAQTKLVAVRPSFVCAAAQHRIIVHCHRRFRLVALT